jgi:Ca2+:H+ antiporter
MPRWFYFLLIFSVLAFILSFFHVPSLLLFAIAALGIMPLAALIGQAVEEIAEHTGERIGGLLFATFGNITELIIGILALTKGLVNVVSASIIGSVIGNLLLVLGVAVIVGGVKHGRLHFQTKPASQYASLLALSIGGLLLPTIADLLAQRNHQTMIAAHDVTLSDFVAVLLLVGYIGSILFSVFHVGDHSPEAEEDSELLMGARSAAAIIRLLTFRYHVAKSGAPGKTGVLKQIDGQVKTIVAHETQQPVGQGSAAVPLNAITQANIPDMPNVGGSLQTILSGQESGKGEVEAIPPLTPSRSASEKQDEHGAPLWRSLLLLMAATVGVAIISEILVDAIEPMTEVLHWNAAFVGLVFLPLIGGLPEYFNTISMSLDKRIEMVLEASAGSSVQIAQLMAPVLVLVSLLMPQRLSFVFSLVDLAVLALATFLFSEITKDGELVWLEGFLLILMYATMAGTVFIFGSV